VSEPWKPTAQAEAERWAQLKSDIIEAAPSLGIDSIGFASADPFTTLKNRLIEHRAKGYESGFEEPDLDKRVQPALLFDRPQSIIAIAVAYPSKLIDPPKSEPGAYRGILSRSAWGQDYHQALRERLARLEAFIQERVPEARMESMVDTGALSDRAVAERAGIGWSAKNCSIISPKLGSWMYLGEMITNLPFEPDTPVEEGCGDCNRCIDACPTGALVGPGQLNAQRCISFLTQTKGTLSEEFMTKIGNRLYGCDTCQIVCPPNRGKNWTQHPELQPDPETVKPLLIPLLSLSNKEFKARFGSNASSWRGKKPIQRNAIIGLGNFKDATAIPHLHTVMREDPRYELRYTAAWALSKIGGEASMIVLNDVIQRESHIEVLEAIQRARVKLGADTEPLFYREMDSPIGTLTHIRSMKGLCHIEFGTYADREEKIQQWTSRWYEHPELIPNSAALDDVVGQLKAYFGGQRTTFDIPLDMQGTPFQRKVWQALTEIPYGETWSYKQVAEQIGQPKSVRAVGGANNKNPVSIIVPCHRVIGASGAMVGYGGGLDKKQILLALEQRQD
jgi:epoxyqueuosine reductase